MRLPSVSVSLNSLQSYPALRKDVRTAIRNDPNAMKLLLNSINELKATRFNPVSEWLDRRNRTNNAVWSKLTDKDQSFFKAVDQALETNAAIINEIKRQDKVVQTGEISHEAIKLGITVTVITEIIKDLVAQRIEAHKESIEKITIAELEDIIDEKKSEKQLRRLAEAQEEEDSEKAKLAELHDKKVNITPPPIVTEPETSKITSSKKDSDEESTESALVIYYPTGSASSSQQADSVNHYEALGLSKGDYSDAEIRSAYLKQSRQHHPDKGGDPEKFKKANEAFLALKEKPMRDKYNKQYKASNVENNATSSSSTPRLMLGN